MIMDLLIRPCLQFADPFETGVRFCQPSELAPSNFSGIRVPTAVTIHCGQHAPEQVCKQPAPQNFKPQSAAASHQNLRECNREMGKDIKLHAMKREFGFNLVHMHALDFAYKFVA